ncbi:MAG: hypothetical protein M1832_005197 [Thelocarpon impressellum]|nr:MAG: hypothetical protein M1832_005197 [Thelocarpon impressellum]
MSDNDGDSHMQTSSSPSQSQRQSASPDVDSEDFMFPNTTADVAASELSPPASQHDMAFITGFTSKVESGTIISGPQYSAHSPWNSTAGTDRDEAAAKINKLRKTQEESAPGWAWNNKRAMEEFARAAEGLVDQNWSLREFICFPNGPVGRAQELES